MQIFLQNCWFTKATLTSSQCFWCCYCIIKNVRHICRHECKTDHFLTKSANWRKFPQNWPFSTDRFSAKFVPKISTNFRQNQLVFFLNLFLKILRNLTFFSETAFNYDQLASIFNLVFSPTCQLSKYARWHSCQGWQNLTWPFNREEWQNFLVFSGGQSPITSCL